MDYAAEKASILAETDMLALDTRLLEYADRAVDASRRDDLAALHDSIRLGHWVMFRLADFTWKPGGMPIGDEHTYAVVKDMSVEAFAAAIETNPPPWSFNEALALAKASRGN